jgi:hypothetical protein
VRCIVCGREFDERGYQLVVPGRTESFDSFECAARARGLPWLGPPPGAVPFERPAPTSAPLPLPAALVAQLARARTRVALAGAAALAVAVTTASAYVWLRGEDEGRVDGMASPGAVAPSAADPAPTTPTTPGAEERGVGAERPATPDRAARPESPKPRRSAADPVLASSPPDEAAPPTHDGVDAGGGALVPATPAAPAGPPSPPPPSRPPRPPRPAPAAPTPAAPPLVTPESRPGWGYGDRNHVHEGPPGAGAVNARAGKKPRAGHRGRRRRR